MTEQLIAEPRRIVYREPRIWLVFLSRKIVVDDGDLASVGLLSTSYVPLLESFETRTKMRLHCCHTRTFLVSHPFNRGVSSPNTVVGEVH